MYPKPQAGDKDPYPLGGYEYTVRTRVKRTGRLKAAACVEDEVCGLHKSIATDVTAAAAAAVAKVRVGAVG